MPVQRRGIRALEIWCQRVTSGYANVDVSDLSTSFRDGLAFCAIIHHFRPELIDYESLKPDQMIQNNELAFQVAEDKLAIPSLLDPEDMVNSDTPDKFSVATYLAQFYHMFKDEDDSKTGSPNLRLVRGSDSSDASSSAEGTPLGTPTLMNKNHVLNSRSLMEKYGQEIFETSSSPKLFSAPSPRFQGLSSNISPALAKKSPNFDPKALLEKYGEEIFSNSSCKTAVKEATSPSVSDVCKEFEIKARVSAFEKQQS